MVPLNINIRDSTLHCSPSRSHPRISLPCPSFFFLAGPGHLHEIAVFLLSGRSRSPTRNRCFSLFAKSTGPVQILFHSNPIGISPRVPPNSLCFLVLPFYPCFYFGPGMGEGERGGTLENYQVREIFGLFFRLDSRLLVRTRYEASAAVYDKTLKFVRKLVYRHTPLVTKKMILFHVRTGVCLQQPCWSTGYVCTYRYYIKCHVTGCVCSSHTRQCIRTNCAGTA